MHVTAGVKDSDGKVHIVFRAFVPNERAWLFRWLFQSAFPQVLRATRCNQVQMVMTDGDSQEISQMDSALQSVFTSAVRRRCGWHIVEKGFAKHVRSLGTSEAAGHVAMTVKNWLYSLMKDVETEEEYRL